MEIIERKSYLERIEKYLGTETIIVLAGQRRVGKSYVLKSIATVKSSDSNVIYIDKEKADFDATSDYRSLNAYIKSHYKEGVRNYVMIDEVQEIEEFEKSLRHWRTEPDTDVLVTGSNAEMLSSDLGSRLGKI